MSSQKTNNSFLREKIILRIKHLPEKEELRVLDCFHGNGCIWDNVVRNAGRKIVIDGLDIKQYDDFAMIGDNVKILPLINLDRYDVIDVDAYGCPYEQIKIISEKIRKPTLVYYTFIQTMMGALPFGMLNEIGFCDDMIKKSPVLFSKSGHEKFISWLSTLGVRRVGFINPSGKKFYGSFILEPKTIQESPMA